MDKDRKKELREQYKNRHPDMGIVCWQCGDKLWAAVSRDAKADYNGTSFQLNLGSWPNREMQALYRERPEDFHWSLAKALDYEDYADDHTDDLQLLLLEFLDEHPDARPMRPGAKWK